MVRVVGGQFLCQAGRRYLLWSQEFLQGDLLPQWLQVKWQMHESLLKREQEDIVLMPSHFQFSYENSSPEKCQRASSSFPQVQQVQHLALSFVKGISALV